MICTYNSYTLTCLLDEIAIPCKHHLWVHTLKSNKLVPAIDNSKIINRKVSQNQDTHGLSRLKTKTSFRHLTKHITYNPFHQQCNRMTVNAS